LRKASDGLGFSKAKGDGSVDPHLLAPDEEIPDEVPGCRAGRDPLIHVLLGAVGDRSAVLSPEPVKELQRFGDVLFGGVYRSARRPAFP
jgi:hypothetical protein